MNETAIDNPATTVEVAPTWPAPGLGATICHWSDRTAGTILAVSASGKTLTIQSDHAELDDWKPEFIPGGFCGHCINQGSQRYRYAPNQTGHIWTVRRRKDGSYRTSQGEKVIEGRSQFHDYNF